MSDVTESQSAWRSPSRGRWILFAVIAIAVLTADQLTKGWVTGTLERGAAPTQVLGDWLRVVYWENSGILFGMLPRSGPAFAFVSLAVAALIVFYHYKAGRGIVTTICLSLLLGGAIGNLLDRLQYGAVVDWIDMGIGTARFWTYNIADAGITTAIVMLIVLTVFPVTTTWGADA